MKIFKELQSIAFHNAQVKRLVSFFWARADVPLDPDDWEVHFDEATLVHGCFEREGHLYQNCLDSDRQLDNGPAVTEESEYYCEQYSGYSEDDFHGNLYFKTELPGAFVKVPFGTYYG